MCEPHNFGKWYLTCLRLHFLVYTVALILLCCGVDTGKEYKHLAQWLVHRKHSLILVKENTNPVVAYLRMWWLFALLRDIKV